MAKDDYSVQPAENTELYTKKIEEQEIKIQLTEEDYKLVKKIYASSDFEDVQLIDERNELIAKSIWRRLLLKNI